MLKPSDALGLLAAGGVGLSAGYLLGAARAARSLRAAARPDFVVDEDFIDMDEDDLAELEPIKMILVVRQDLKMGKGKIAAQCCHAACGAVQEQYTSAEGMRTMQIWEVMGQTKVAVKAETEEVLLDVERQCQEEGIPSYLVIDAGRTQIAPNTRTVLAVGPAAASSIDKVTGHLKLL